MSENNQSYALVMRLEAAARYLAEEADFNLSWTDGSRDPGAVNHAYLARRLEIAEERNSWAVAILDAISALSAHNSSRTMT